MLDNFEHENEVAELFGKQPEKSRLVLLVEQIVDEFQQGQPETDAAHHLSSAFDLLIKLTRQPRARLLPSQTRQLLRAVAKAHARNATYVSALASPIDVQAGFDAAVGLVLSCGESDEQRRARHPHFYADLAAHADILKHLLYAISLRQEIAERALERQHETVAELRRAVGAA